jgi:hypothetical protein
VPTPPPDVVPLESKPERQGPPVVGIGASERRHISKKLGLLPALV